MVMVGFRNLPVTFPDFFATVVMLECKDNNVWAMSFSFFLSNLEISLKIAIEPIVSNEDGTNDSSFFVRFFLSACLSFMLGNNNDCPNDHDD